MQSLLFSKKNLIWILGLLTVAAMIYLGDASPNELYYYTIGLALFVFILLWLGNEGINKLFNQRMPWERYGKSRFFTQLMVGNLLSVSVINLAYFGFKVILTEGAPIIDQIVVLNVWGIVITIPSFSIYYGLNFLKHWQQSQIEVEKFQKETMISQLTNLKNHLDPHFLFNNLNILSSLIDKDRDLSQEFLVRFAQVYRTLLLNKGEDLVTLEEELEFIQSYIFLIQVRFENNIQFDINISQEAHYYMIPPLTIQMLIENAIKHNLITQNRPLLIKITTNNSRLHVCNSLYVKREDLITKSGTGLNNIKERFKYFSDEELVFEKNEEEFRVSIPLLEIETL